MGSGESFEVRMARDKISYQQYFIFYVLVLEKRCTNIFQYGSPKAKQICDGSLACPVNDSRFPIFKMAALSLSHHLLSVFQA